MGIQWIIRWWVLVHCGRPTQETAWKSARVLYLNQLLCYNSYTSKVIWSYGGVISVLGLGNWVFAMPQTIQRTLDQPFLYQFFKIFKKHYIYRLNLYIPLWRQLNKFVR